ncbi:MAG TPA: non-ribosomal peptide synthase/polyketide synthase, partial [Thermoanaerobaculia bacterium]|nr:non-ribosomal peptide synthase/polyketide synthase [Thermoanaerobaculia bacterium]
MSERTGLEIAVIGLAGRFPGAGGVEELWRNLRDGVESISRFSDEELAAAGASPELLANPRYVKAGTVLEGADLLDAGFFGITPREAEVIDPQHRLFLECSWEALEAAGYDPETCGRSIGVYGGVSFSTYMMSNLWSNRDRIDLLGGMLGIDKDHLATLVSYKLNLEGPSLAVQTACSTSLVAVHLAAQGLLNGECGMALAGGVSIRFPQRSGYFWSEGGILSPDGHCRAFDAQAGGTVFGDGVGVVVLKRLEDALADGDAIHAVIKGSAINNDGAGRMGYTAPRMEGQTKVIRAAQAMAEVAPGTIGYVEAHGTGTPLGDPIEVSALTEAFRAGTDRRGFCALGSIKPNIGHLNAASGVAGLIKAVLALEHRTIPPSLRFATPNPQIDWAASPFFVNTELLDWPGGDEPRRAGVSSFGMGGTNAHVVLEEAPEPEPTTPSRALQMLVLSARSDAALEAATDRLAAHLAAHPEMDLADVAHTLHAGRRGFGRRRFVLAASREEAARLLAERDPRRVLTAPGGDRERPIFFLFPGQGAQHPGMARGLYESEPVFREELDRCVELLRPRLGFDLRDVLFPAPEKADEAAERLGRTALTQPALFAVEYALARLWMEWGVRPQGMIGHSLGEYVAACLSGVFSLEDALHLVALRGRLIQELPGGAMLAVPLPPERLEPLLGAGVSLAAVNGPSMCVVSGTRQEIERLRAEVQPLLEEGLECRPLHTSHAFHSAAMDSILGAFTEAVRLIGPKAPALPFVSNVTGRWITPAEAADPAYWARHMRQAVRFSAGLETLLAAAPDGVLLEVGPGRTLGTLARQHPATTGRTALASARHPQDGEEDQEALLRTLGQLWLAGAPVDWRAFYARERRRRLPLPTYPFERRRYWIEPRPDNLVSRASELEALEEEAPAEETAHHPRPGLGTAYVAPHTEAERALAAVWQDLFGIAEVGIHDDFSDLGGHSLLVTQMASRVREALGVELPLRTFFEARTVARLAQAIEGWRAGEHPLPTPLMTRAPRDGALPLSFGQQRLWFLDRLEPGSPAYNIPFAVRLAGRLDEATLERTLGEIVRRHEALRTTFRAEGSQPVQQVHPARPLRLAVVDLSGLPGDERSERAQRLATEEARQPFDLDRGPLLRACLLRLDPAEHVALLTLHHIVADGWSVGVLVREMAALYQAFAAGQASPLPELPLQYADFSRWQRDWLRGEVLEGQIAYWRRRLAGAPALLELPADRPRLAVQRFQGGRRRIVLDQDLVRRLRSLARQREATMFMALLAALTALLRRYTGQEDVVLGTPIAGRGRAETEDLIGLFLNTLVLRADLPGNPDFLALLDRARDVSLEAYEHQDLPFEKLVDEMELPRDLSHTPLFQVLLVLQNTPLERLELPGLTLLPMPGIEGATAKFDLAISFAEAGEGIAGYWKYNGDLFDPATAERMCGHFEQLLAALAGEPSARLSDLSLLKGGERQQLLEWNATAADYSGGPGERCLHEWIEAQAARTPAAVGVVCEGEALTYGELDARADRLARVLRGLGAGAETRVGICVERSLEMMVGLLGILKAGAAYVPLDPSYPVERLAFMLEDSQRGLAAPVLLTQKRLLGALPEHSARTICLDEPLPEAGAAIGGKPRPDHLAYAIFTSGSTGRPKGAMNSHRGIVNRLLWMQEAFGLTAEDRVVQKTPISFDVSVWELFWPLMVGARLVIARPGGHQDPAYLMGLIAEQGVTTIHFVPSMLQVFLEAPGLDGCGSLRRVVASGEALPQDLERRFFERLGWTGAGLFNLYGPTEAAVDVTVWSCERDGRRAAVPIGRPIANTRIHLLGRFLEEVPIGVAGELHIGGVQVGRGYLDRPGLTAERFIPDPFGEPGERLYKTGDLARHLADGAIEFLGRIDHQVKIRGFRIELGEIESALAAHPSVREAVVVAREGSAGLGAGDWRLVAYVVPEAGGEVDPAGLRSFLAAALPEYMLPSAWVALEAMPLSPSGKVDRRALPREERPLEPGTEAMAPRNALERYLALLWSELLGVEGVGIQDDFFALGGNSITGAVLINRLQERLGEIVHVVVLFDAPTVAKMGAHLVREHAPAASRLFGPEVLDAAVAAGEMGAGRIGGAEIERFRSLIVPLTAVPAPAAKIPRAVFVVSPPRSGSTLLRVMLGGHPKLFSPPELELLGFGTLAERRDAFPGRDSFWLEGAIRAVMEIRRCGPDEARTLMADLEERGVTTAELYGLLQEWLGERILVDKTPSYALDPAVLRRAEEVFEEPFYIHLIRHPYGMIHSFEEAKLDQLFFRREHSFARRELAELIWLASHRNVAEFLSAIPAGRQHWVRFEDLVAEPEKVLRGLCAALGIDYHPDMAEPYKEKSVRMTDGLHAESRMLGDVKFHQHSGVDRQTAERWREAYRHDFLGEATWTLAGELGYPAERTAPPPPSLARVPRDGDLPLSFGQQRLWFLDQLDPGSPVYNLSGAVRLQGRLDGAALTAALGEIVRRHEVLRTTFVATGREPAQAVHPPRPAVLPLVDLTGLPEAGREAAARHLTLADLRQPFDLARGPLLRATLVKVGEAEHLLLFAMHHIVSDGWSMGLLFREVGALYRAFVSGERPSLPELPIQYGDYAVWQRSWLQGEVLAGHVAWWREQLAGAPALLRLPTDHPRPAVQRFRGARVDSWLSPEAHSALRSAGQRQGATLFMSILAAYSVLLGRHGGGDDLVVGTPSANRDRAELEGLIGFFVNTLAMRTGLAGDPTSEELLARVRRAALGAYAHQDLPFEKLVEELQPERSLSHSPLFQVMLVLQNAQNATGGAIELPGLTLRAEGRPQEISKFDLTLNVAETSTGLFCQWRYNVELYDASTVERLADHLRVLVEGIAADPSRPVAGLPLLSPLERHQLLREWSRGEASPSGVRGLHEMVEQQAVRRPDAPAVVFEGAELSYGELDRRANRLARHLRRLGVGPEVPVALSVERSPELVVGLIAVLKAGGAYVPLDPAYPAERLAWLAADCGAPLLLNQERLTAELDASRGESAERIEPGVGPDNLAYVIYTSGSTGMPKGVLVSHRGLDNLAEAQGRLFEVGPESRVLQFASLSFDASVSEIAMAFRAGAALHLAPRRALLPGLELIELLRGQAITTVTLPPTTLAAMPEGGLPALRTLVVAGEACAPELARRWAAGRRLLNAYGPTEATVCATAALYDGGDRLPIGRPIQNVETFVVDSGGQPVPAGVAGELLVGGPGLARGYRGRPDLTAERFVPHPFTTTPGERLYRTGDLVRFLGDGELEFLGRIDHQVKIRGVRVEPGEVEAALLALPGVREAIAVAREDGAGPTRLVAYAVGTGLDGTDLRAALAASLPELMVPAAVVVLEALPLTPNGKVDRKALPAPEGRGEKELVAPRTELERFLVGLWQDVLGCASLGVHDDFFELGGNSITGAMFVNRLQRELGEIVHVVVMFDAPTVAQLAAWVTENYPEAVVRLFGHDALGMRKEVRAQRVDAVRVLELRSLVPPLPPATEAVEKNPPAAFVLSPPRSGSTLLRVMLGGNPALFAPPELELLSFDTLAERREAFPGRNSFWLEGVTRAVMEVRRCEAEEANALLEELERAGTTTRGLYRKLQEWIGGRLLVDKTPSYALDLSVLRRAEAGFEGARYIHLLRHPYGMIRSFEEAKLEQVFFRHPHSYSRRELAELIWLVSQQNILEFLDEVPAERRMRVRFEDLLAEPEPLLRGICEFLGVEYHPDMAEPYKEKSARMTDGIHAWSRMLGDVKFHQHSGVDRPTADRWREEYREDFLGGVTWKVAGGLGYSLRAPRDGDLPLSFGQQRLWFLDRLDPESTAYNMSAAVRLTGGLDVAALRAALDEIVRRHESLRTTFAAGEREPVQVIHPPRPAGLLLADLAGLPEAGRETTLKELSAEIRLPFDLARGPLLRAALARVGKQEHVLLFTMHHIVSDGWSMGVLVREVGALYAAFVSGEPSPLPELPIQYADYAVWQRSWLQGDVLATHIGYWRERLAGAPALLRLPADHPRPAVQRFQGARVDSWLPPEAVSALRSAGQRQGATLFMALLAAYSALLGRHAGEDDVVVGTPTANRDRAELEGLIGFFVNTLALRTRLTGAPSFEKLLAWVRETALGAYTHQDLPFEKLVEELQPERSLAHSPLFQVMLVLQNIPGSAVDLPGLTLRAEGKPQEISKFDLTLTASESSGGLLCQWRYNVELFDASTIERLADHLRILVEGIATDPARAVAGLPLLSPLERHQLLHEWSRGEATAPGIRGLHEMVEAQAERRPDAPAVVFEGGELTYAGLNRRANRLARRLRRLGVGPEVPVGVCVERSPEMVIGLIAVLKAGGAYVPLDPAYPTERLAWLMADCGAPVLLTQARLLAELPAHGARTVLLDKDVEEIAAGFDTGTGSDNLAYVIYTSGSTGTPKGVLVSHRGLDNLAEAQGRLFEVGPESRVLQFASLSFDASVSEIAMAFRAGAALHLAPRRALLPGRELIELLRGQAITTVTLPPTALAALPEADLPDLRTLIVAGEACAPELARRWAAGRRLLNAYGPTEATVCATTALYAGGSRLPIGRPIQNVETYVVDPAGQPVPAGVAGELLVGGIGLARGYRGRPDLTAERFVPHPFAIAAGERLYRTGDLARFLADGELEFLGRIDHQVKIRGVRVEPGEVEAALLALPGVREAVAVAREDGTGPARLVAYVTPAGLDPLALRSALAASLPEPMVPAAVVVLEALPLTPNGKVDRKALPTPEGARVRDLVAPRTELERFLAGLWQDVLGVGSIPGIGVHDDFFELGGNSITGAMFVNRLQQELGEIVHVVVMFDAPTVEQLAAWVTENYPEAVARLFGHDALGERKETWFQRVDAAQVSEFRSLIPMLPTLIDIEGTGPVEKSPPAAFVLSPPRSGSTLLRVMLGGNPNLFAPPELELLSFDTLAERREAFPGRNSFWLEGVTRAVMEVRRCTAEEADALLEEIEREGMTTRGLYRKLQEWIGGRLLVDKTPSYALDLSVLRRAEATFEDARYIHLLRHPYGMIRSFEEAKLEQVFFRHPHPYPRRELAELIWLVSQQNILEFLAGVPAGRQKQVRFEELLAEPEGVLREICEFLGVEYHPDMAEPYKEKSARMTDGIHTWSRMLGDVKFHQHSGVNRRTADRWRDEYQEDFLGGPAWELAERLGYPAERGTGPLSFAQERLWVLDRMDPGSPAYNIPVAVRLSGRLDAGALAESLTEIVRRHAVLRSVFSERVEGPVQIVMASEPVPLPAIDLEALPPAVRETEARRLSREIARLPFDLTRGPMLRAVLVRFEADEHAAFFTMHHIASDGWSMGVLIGEMSALYAAYLEGRPSPLPELPVQYLDYARWQRSWLTPERLEQELAYWRQALAGIPALQLPTDRPRPPFQTFRGAMRGFTVPAATAAALKAMGQGQGGTLFMVLLAAFAALLHRYSGQDDVAIGSPVANRTRAQIEGLIGFFINTLALRTDLTGAPSFEGLLARVRRETVAAFAHQELPFEKVVFELQPERNLAMSPLFQVMFAMQNAPTGSLSLPGLTLRPFATEIGTAKFDLTLNAVERGGGLAGSLEYNTDLFDRSTIDRMLGHFVRLLEAVAAEPGASVADLPLLSAGERDQLLVEWNATGREVPAGLVHDWIAAQAARTPEAVAVTFGAESLTYGELDRRANGLAWRLRDLGVGPEARVGIALERSLEMVVAVLGVLKAGGAYVPLDPSYPAERLAFMKEDAGLAAVLESLDFEESLEAPRVDLGPDNAAYVIYTSGSTGRPKGVQIPHGALANFLVSMAEKPGLEAGDVLLAVTSLSFDIAGLELFLPLMQGGRIVLASREETADGRRLQELLAGATVLQATPATWRLLIDSGWQGGEGLKALCGGEALAPSLAASLLERVGSLWNVYGPTETTVWSTVEEIQGLISIGRPIANTEAYVLDGRGNPVPVGALGELVLGGKGVARGYLGRPDLTAEKFVPNPFGAPGSRLYRTGDLAHWRPDGTLECLGRIDHQVKVRGFRIELGEIEAALGRHPDVAAAVVMVRGERLVAYVVGRISGDLRDWLRRSLPDYMIPTAWVALDELPLTPNGKVDRKALPAPAAEAGSEVAPRTPTEEVLAGIWAHVLHRETVGAEDSFFDLGGHSLLATQVVSRVREAFGVELPLRRMFESPTLAGLARAIEMARTEGLEAPPLVRAARDGDLPLSFAQQRLWLLDQLAPGNPFYNLSGAMRIAGNLDVEAFRAAVTEVVRRHETLRTGFVSVDGQPVQRIEPAAAFEVPLVEVLPEQVREMAAELARRPFDLSRPPLLRVSLLRLGEAEHVLLFSMHHIISDNWSMRVLVGEVARLYAGLTLPELPVQYADFAVWQRGWLQGEALERQLGYWKEQLAGAPPVELPADRPRPPVQTFRGAVYRTSLPSRAGAVARERGVSPFMVLLGAFQALVSRYTGQEDVVAGSPIANRTRSELEGLIGFFVNTLVMRTDLAGDPTVVELLSRVRETALGAYTHQDLPFEYLVERLQPERDLSRNPLFQLMFNLLNAPVEKVASADLSLSPLESPGSTALFDLQVYVTETSRGLSTSWEYATDLFDPATIERLARHFGNLLEGIAAHQEARLSELPLLGPGERDQLLLEWNATDRPVPAGLVHEWIAAQAARTPEAVAVTFGAASLTYRELDRRANGLAWRLRSLGVGPEVRVGIALERSLEMVVAVLGVLKAGGVYVPLDPSYPSERLAFMKADAGLAAVLESVDFEEASEAPRLDLSPDNAAYVIYTSGSTGRPKGVQIPHGALANFLASMAERPGFSAQDVLLAVTSLSFDIAGLELYLPLMQGGRMVLASREEAADGRRLQDLLAGATVLQATPATWRLLIDSGWQGSESLKALCGGEALAPSLAASLLDRVGSLWNVYGPTETTVWSTVEEIRGPLSIGRPIGNTEAYVLDSRGNPVPVGALGELVLGGKGVARGYLGRPDLTAEKLVPNPFGSPGSRLYRTGDLARYRVDGTLECLGRIDHQVKVRGFRIELGEIEAALGRHPDVTAAVVVARDERLVAYVVGRISDELRAWLRRSLPEYMVPTAWVALER